MLRQIFNSVFHFLNLYLRIAFALPLYHLYFTEYYFLYKIEHILHVCIYFNFLAFLISPFLSLPPSFFILPTT